MLVHRSCTCVGEQGADKTCPSPCTVSALVIPFEVDDTKRGKEPPLRIKPYLCKNEVVQEVVVTDAELGVVLEC